MRTIRVAILNIVMPDPHGAERYRQMFQAAYRLRQPVELRGKYKGLLGALSANRRDRVVGGEFYKFFDLDPNADWFNIDRRELAEEELKQISARIVGPGLAVTFVATQDAIPPTDPDQPIMAYPAFSQGH